MGARRVRFGTQGKKAAPGVRVGARRFVPPPPCLPSQFSPFFRIDPPPHFTCTINTPIFSSPLLARYLPTGFTHPAGPRMAPTTRTIGSGNFFSSSRCDATSCQRVRSWPRRPSSIPAHLSRTTAGAIFVAGACSRTASERGGSKRRIQARCRVRPDEKMCGMADQVSKKRSINDHLSRVRHSVAPKWLRSQFRPVRLWTGTVQREGHRRPACHAPAVSSRSGLHAAPYRSIRPATRWRGEISRAAPENSLPPT